MQNSKTKITAFLMATTMFTNANAQFYDLNDQGMVMPAGNYQTQQAFSDSNQEIENPELETSGDEGGFVAEQPKEIENPSARYNDDYATLPMANGFDSFTNNMFKEEDVKEQLRNIDQLDYIGFMDADFDEALWLGVDFGYAEKSFANFKNIKSMHVKQIMRNMLMAKARVPQTEKSWLVLRLKTLLDMGNLSDVRLLLKDVSPKELTLLKNAELNTLYLKANLLDVKTFAFLKDILEQEPNNVDYKKAFIINLYNQGMANQAKLTFNALLDVNDDVKNSDFAKIFESILNNKEYSLEKNATLDVYNQYLIALNTELFDDVDYNNFTDQVLMAAIENSTNVSDKTKFAEIMMNNYPYSYSVDYLSNIYAEHQFSNKDLSVPLKYIENSNNEYANRSLLFQASKVQGLNSTKAIALKKLWESYDDNSLANLKALVTEKTQNIAVNSSIAWFSLDLLKNSLKQAQMDYQTLNVLYQNIDNSYMSNSALNLQMAVEFLRRTSLVSSDFDSIQDYKDILNTWFKAREIKTEEDYNYVLKVLTLLDALNAEIPNDVWSKLYSYAYLSKGDKSNPVWLRLITSAMQNNEKGKALLLIAEMFVNEDEKDLEPQTLANIVSALNYLNMPQDMALIGVNAIIK